MIAMRCAGCVPGTRHGQAPSKQLADALFASSRHMSLELHFNKGLAGAPQAVVAAARDTATNPALLDAFALAIIATGGAARYPGLGAPVLDQSAARLDAVAVGRAARELLKITPEAGSYVSESDFFNQRWSHAFWGPHYSRLKRVKMTYDPAGLFFMHHGVGSEHWSADGFERKG
jgi:hypothetical protein